MSYAAGPFHSVINIIYDNTLRGAEALPIPTDAFPAFLYPKLEICFSRSPLSSGHIGLYVAPAHILPLHQNNESPRHCGAVPVIAYGPERLLALAFDCGCCDYLRSPWTLNELKVRALRSLPPRQLEFEWGTITLEGEQLRLLKPPSGSGAGRRGQTAAGPPANPANPAGCSVERPGRPDHSAGPPVRPAELKLSSSEQAILRLLIVQSGTPVCRECLQAGLQGHPGKTASSAGHSAGHSAGRSGSRSVDVHISTLRKKFNLLAGKRLQPHPIRSIYGYGYVLIHKQSTPYSCCG